MSDNDIKDRGIFFKKYNNQYIKKISSNIYTQTCFLEMCSQNESKQKYKASASLLAMEV